MNMPYNTTAIPPRKEVTGQTQLPLSRVKKIVAQDQDIGICSNNAAFVITLATEMFIQYLAGEGFNMARTERKPRRNIQYKDLASAVAAKENLEFLEDVVPKTVPFKRIKAEAAATRAQLSSNASAVDRPGETQRETANGSGSGGGGGAGGSSSKKHRPSTSRSSLNGSFVGASGARIVSEDEDTEVDPADQLRNEMREASRGGRDEDVDMTG
ncbi:histone-fold-containing protein [Annulohypoxylon maeteangense]|uniref:histone-fold-containing protein n=1 Tax=Annulohypoxylon maeteangense TaxID=1927788 RepID=UPI0020075603|nr:histone-fold-containing protein [Annulohypoxylon maeteangense]KAI0888731.1 histone-fold-containing protein [Annulohypoxylon maeteangense]